MNLKMISWVFTHLPCIYQNVAVICMSYLWHHSRVYVAVSFRLMFLDDDLMCAHTVIVTCTHITCMWTLDFEMITDLILSQKMSCMRSSYTGWYWQIYWILWVHENGYSLNKSVFYWSYTLKLKLPVGIWIEMLIMPLKLIVVTEFWYISWKAINTCEISQLT